MRAMMTAAIVLSTPALAGPEQVDDKVSVLALAGIATLTGGLSEVTALGPTWGVIVGTEPFETLSFEVAYEGARFPMDDPDAEGEEFWRNGVSGLVKLETSFGVAEPFIGAGFGVSYWNPKNDLVAELPVTAGLDVDAGPLDAGIRASLRGLIGTGFTGAQDPGGRSGSLLSASVVLGGAF